MKAVRIEGLTKRYEKIVAVDGLNLTIENGEIFSLLGVNGAGKTTTVKILSCLSKPDEGDAFIFGKSVLKESGAVKSLIALSPQETAVAPNLSARENLFFMCGLHRFSKEKTKERIDELSALLDLESILDRKAGKLSGGWKRRLSIAMALISEPKLLFLDEPSLGLDVISRSELWDVILALKGKTTVLLTTHYMEEAEKLSDRVAIMKDGRLLVCDTVSRICEEAGEEKLENAFIRITKEEMR